MWMPWKQNSQLKVCVVPTEHLWPHTPYCARWTSLDKLQSWIRLVRSELDLDMGRSCKAFLMFSALLLALLILTSMKLNSDFLKKMWTPFSCLFFASRSHNTSKINHVYSAFTVPTLTLSSRHFQSQQSWVLFPIFTFLQFWLFIYFSRMIWESQ